jgi:hypothetical protein
MRTQIVSGTQILKFFPSPRFRALRPVYFQSFPPAAMGRSGSCQVLQGADRGAGRADAEPARFTGRGAIGVGGLPTRHSAGAQSGSYGRGIYDSLHATFARRKKAIRIVTRNPSHFEPLALDIAILAP